MWDGIREKNFPNRVHDSMDAVREQLLEGLKKPAAEAAVVRSLTAWRHGSAGLYFATDQKILTGF